jgi:probable phosphoglycerate mutase
VAVVVTHGGTAGRLMERLLEIDWDHRRILGPLGNCAWSELSRQGDRWRLVRHNTSVLPLPAAAADGAAHRPPAVRALPGGSPGVDDGAPMTDADAVN